MTEVREKLSKIRPLGDFEVRLEIGDAVRPVAAEHPVAVLPFGRDSGQLIQGGVQLAEQVTSSLSKNGVVVVERALLNKILQELSLTETGIFDLDTARKVGKLLQAHAIVSGTIQVNPRDANVNVAADRAGDRQDPVRYVPDGEEPQHHSRTAQQLSGRRNTDEIRSFRGGPGRRRESCRGPCGRPETTGVRRRP